MSWVSFGSSRTSGAHPPPAIGQVPQGQQDARLEVGDLASGQEVGERPVRSTAESSRLIPIRGQRIVARTKARSRIATSIGERAVQSAVDGIDAAAPRTTTVATGRPLRAARTREPWRRRSAARAPAARRRSAVRRRGPARSNPDAPGSWEASGATIPRAASLRSASLNPSPSQCAASSSGMVERPAVIGQSIYSPSSPPPTAAGTLIGIARSVCLLAVGERGDLGNEQRMRRMRPR